MAFLIKLGSEDFYPTCQIALFILYCSFIFENRPFFGHVILIHSIKQPVDFFIAGQKRIAFPLFLLPFKLYSLLKMFHNRFDEFILILARKFCEPADFSQHDLLQKVNTDVMSRGASVPITFVVVTIS